ncbi:MAG: hypothetical protein SVW02_02435 [Candidatus Nanohaloarchaea archaeon]|nr:hypothetical protein [Candidatus Nanohaloarchaea archaeon]
MKGDRWHGRSPGREEMPRICAGPEESHFQDMSPEAREALLAHPPRCCYFLILTYGGSRGGCTMAFTVDRELIGRSAEEAVRTYRERYDGSVPVTLQEMEEILAEGEIAGEEDVETFFTEISGLYDDLLAVDSDDHRDDFRDNIRYDPSMRQVLSDSIDRFGAAYAAGGALLEGGLIWLSGVMQPGLELALVAGGAGTAISIGATYLSTGDAYNQWRDTIGVGRRPRQEVKTFEAMSEELCHAYQFAFESPTADDILLQEGMARAAAVKSLEAKAERAEAEGWRRAADGLRAQLLLNGYGQIGWIDGCEPSVDNFMDIGVPEAEAEQLVENAGDSIYHMYCTGSAAVLSNEYEEGATYAEVFHGDVDTSELDPYREASSLGRKIWHAIGSIGMRGETGTEA